MTYYGLSWNTSNLGGNDYINFVISGAVEIPAYTFLLLTLNRWGRKTILCGCMVIAGISLLLTMVVPNSKFLQNESVYELLFITIYFLKFSVKQVWQQDFTFQVIFYIFVLIYEV